MHKSYRGSKFRDKFMPLSLDGGILHLADYNRYYRLTDDNKNKIRRISMAKIELKQPVVKEISDLLEGVQSAVLVDYRGLTVEQDTKLRKELREAGVSYKVYKNTLINLAVQGTEFESLSQVLEGPTALAVSKDDATAPARILHNFAKTAPALELKAGIVEGTYYDADAIKAVAAIPGRDELLGRLLGSIKSPISNLARVLNQIAEKQDA
jgi:ribosomal protein L10